ncbi:hypothetical protein X772_23365 [Mesorhizobium sp. LSJC280B00]|nr:hypothetical protein X772_23365 [Mesorhizobium sp. LSJC280B00]
MPRYEFVLRPDIEQHDFVVSHAAHEFLARDVFQPVRLADPIVDKLTDLLASVVCKISQRRKHVFDWAICKPVQNAFSVSPGLHQARSLEVLKMLRRIR